jgi:hypothetical protein
MEYGQEESSGKEIIGIVIGNSKTKTKFATRGCT